MSTSTCITAIPNKYQLRRAEASDAQALAAIRRDAILTLAVPALAIAEAETWARQVAADRFLRAIHEHEVWVAVADTVVGWVEIDQARVAALYVAPLYARQGVGSALLAHAEAVIQRSGYRMAYLEASQNALAFYRQRAYRQAGPPTTDGAYPLHKPLTTDRPNEGTDAVAEMNP
jgi:GNAT superfamily N-acetyltransferase